MLLDQDGVPSEGADDGLENTQVPTALHAPIF